MSDGHNLYLTYKIKCEEKLSRYDEYTFVGMESYQIEFKFKGKEAPSNFNVKIKINEIGGVNSNIEDILKEVNLYDDKGEKIASHRYDEDGI